jgi:hypothetical protein
MIDGPEDIEWTFLRVASSVPVVILNSDEKNRTEDGVSGTSSDSKSDFKYHKEVWPDITIHITTEADAGSYTCKVMKTGQTATAQLYIIGEYVFPHSFIMNNWQLGRKKNSYSGYSSIYVYNVSFFNDIN